MGTRHDECMQMLVRHQWVREHGTPRVSTLAGRPDVTRAVWLEWLRLTGRADVRRLLFAEPSSADAAWLDRTATKAASLASQRPREPIALVVTPQLLDRWLAARHDRVAAMIAEGVIRITARALAVRRGPSAKGAQRHVRARSLAELTLFEALQATPATAGRFALNEHLSLQFGSRAAEIDLVSRADQIAIEVDGYHHFGDAEHYRRDRRKDLVLQAHGYTVLRFLAEDVLADARTAVAAVVELLGRRLARQRRGGSQ